MEKQCNKCLEIKDLDEFQINKSCKNGRVGTCKICTNARIKKWTHEIGRHSPKKPPRSPIPVRDGVYNVPLTKGKIALIDAEDTDLCDNNWSVQGSRYAGRNNKGKVLLMHVVILERKIGRPLGKDEITDHRNGNTFDNRRVNLRVATYIQNGINSKLSKTNLSGYKGVSRNHKRWSASITHNRKPIYLGTFDTPIEAARAYDKEAKRRFGEFARLNFPD